MRPVAIALALALAVVTSLLWSGNARADRAEARGLVRAGNALARAGDAAGALARYEGAIRVADDYLPAYEGAIPLWIGANRFRDVRRNLERVTLRHPNHADAWYALAYAYRRLGRPRLSVVAYQIYLPLRPHTAAAWFGIAMAYKQSGQRVQAIAAFRRYVKSERDPTRAAFVTQAKWQIDSLVRWHGPGGPGPRLIADGSWIAAVFVGRPGGALAAVALTQSRAAVKLLVTPSLPPAR